MLSAIESAPLTILSVPHERQTIPRSCVKTATSQNTQTRLIKSQYARVIGRLTSLCTRSSAFWGCMYFSIMHAIPSPYKISGKSCFSCREQSLYNVHWHERAFGLSGLFRYPCTCMDWPGAFSRSSTLRLAVWTACFDLLGILSIFRLSLEAIVLFESG